MASYQPVTQEFLAQLESIVEIPDGHYYAYR